MFEKLLAEKPDYTEKPSEYIAWYGKMKGIDKSSLLQSEQEIYNRQLIISSQIVQELNREPKVVQVRVNN